VSKHTPEGAVLKEFGFTVPLIPPSVNHYKTRFANGNTVVSKEAAAFKAAVARFAKGRFVTAKEFYVRMVIVLGKGERGDVDNFPKLVLDGMADCGVFRDNEGKRLSDSHVVWMSVSVDRNSRPDQGQTDVEVRAL